MASDRRSSASHKPRLPLTLCLALLLIAVVLGVGGALGIHSYRLTSRIALDAAEAVSQRMAREVALEIEDATAPAKLLVDVVATQDITQATTVDQRMRQLPMFAEALNRNAAISAFYIGYADGSFFLVRSLRDRAVQEALKAPLGAAFAVQSIEMSTSRGTPLTRFMYLSTDLSVTQSVERSDFAFDPRTRGWYLDAIGSDRGVLTTPYIFFTTREPGITYARRARQGASVVGADIALTSLSQLLQRMPATASSELFLLTDDARVIARNGTGSMTRVDSTNQTVRLAPLAEAPRVSAAALASRIASGTADHPFEFTAAERGWIARVQHLDGSGGSPPFHLAIASPADELLKSAREMRERSILVTLIMVALAIPLAFVVASRVSRPLRRLASDAQAIQAFDFTDTPPVRSVVREIDRLGATIRSSRISLRHFLDISGTLAAERNMELLLARVLQETMQLAGADAACVHLVDEKRRVLDPAQYVRKGEAVGEHRLPPLSLQTAGVPAQPLLRAALDGTTELIDLDREDEPARAWLGAEAAQIGGGTLSLLVTPLRDRAGRIIGVLSLLSAHVRAAKVSREVVAFVEKLSGVAAIAIETQRLIAEQKALLNAFIQLVAAAIDAKSPYTGGHCQRVPELTKLLAQAACDAREGPFRDFSLDDDDWEAVHIASWLHDCGKVTTPEYVVDKATKLQTIYDRIHEVRMRFEVLKRDAEIEFWKGRGNGRDESELTAWLTRELQALDEEFTFIATCNQGSESMDASMVERVKQIARRTWRRTLDDRLGLSWEELGRKERRPAPVLPVMEPLLSDAPEHLIERRPGERMPDDNRWGFRLDVPNLRYDLGEIHNLIVNRGTLTREERYAINEHIVQTIIMLENLPFPRHLASVPEIAGGHHETMDGRGYPRRLTSTEMSPVARMMAIADIFEALTAVDRPYKKGKTLTESLGIMARMRDERHIDADLFELFLTSGVYRRYAEKYLHSAQIDEVDIETFLARAPLSTLPA